MLIFSAFKPDAKWPRPLGAMYGAIAPFRIVNGYGLFRVMTKERPEIVIEGSDDGNRMEALRVQMETGRARSACRVSSSRISRDSTGRCGSRRWAMRGKSRGFSGSILRLLENSPDVARSC